MGIEKIVEKIDELWQGADLSGIIDKLKGADKLTDVNTVLATTFSAVEEQLGDGFQITDIIPILSAALHDIMEVAESIEGATGAEKREFVTAMMVGLYRFVDKGIDGTKNRIDIPWVPDIVENYIEDKILPIVITFGLEGIVKAWNKFRKDD